MERMGDTLRLIPKPNVLDPGLNNPNFMIHPAPMLLNYAAVERQDGYLSIMNEGMTPGVLRLLDAVDEEKMALQRALGLDVVFIDDLYRQTGSGPHVYRVQGEPFNLRDRIWDRYITEDVPYGSVLYSSLGRLLEVPTPINDSINTLFCVTEEEDYWATGRNAEAMDIAGMNREQLLHYLKRANGGRLSDRWATPFRGRTQSIVICARSGCTKRPFSVIGTPSSVMLCASPLKSIWATTSLVPSPIYQEVSRPKAIWKTPG